jgi:PKD repeat protein
MLAMGLIAFVGLLLAGAVSGEGTILVDIGDDLTTQEDKSVTITSLVSYTGTKNLWYSWDFGDGTTSTSQRPTHVWTRAANYTVTLSVTDDEGITDNDSIFVEVLNVRPIADAGGNRSIMEGTSITFDASGSWDTASDLPLLTYEWDFGDGTARTGASNSNKVVTHTYAETGVYIVLLVVRDDDWTANNTAFIENSLLTVTGSATGNGTVTFSYEPPVYNGTGGNSTNSTGGSGLPTGYYWDFGDGSYDAGPNATHTYASDGVYVVTFIITDAFGALSIHNILITVLNSPPTAEAGPDQAGNEDQVLTFQGQGSDPGGGTVTYSWNFGDGHTATTQVATHAFTQEGTYTVTLTVTDSDGLTGSDTCQVSVVNLAPTAGLTRGPGTQEGDVITFSGVTSTDTASDLPLLTYEWTFGDTTTGTGSSVTHAYADEGTFTVTLTVTDDDGLIDVASTSLTLTNAAPVAAIVSAVAAQTPILPNDNITFTGQATDKGSADTLTVGWTFGDGSTATGSPAVHNYSSAGTFTVTLTVTDNDGATDTATTTVVVDSLTNATEDAQDMVTEAPTSSFDKGQDRKLISDKFDDLIVAIDNGSLNQILADIHVLEVQIDIKVTDETLKAELLAYLQNIKDSLG